LVRHAPINNNEAQAFADATFRAQARRFVTAIGIARGDGRIRVGVELNLEDLGPLSGSYYVSEVRHLFTRSPGGGYTTEFIAERPGLGRAQ
jgi:phage protein D